MQNLVMKLISEEIFVEVAINEYSRVFIVAY